MTTLQKQALIEELKEDLKDSIFDDFDNLLAVYKELIAFFEGSKKQLSLDAQYRLDTFLEKK